MNLRAIKPKARVVRVAGVMALVAMGFYIGTRLGRAPDTSHDQAEHAHDTSAETVWACSGFVWARRPGLP
jgi:NhaP-type Na+/H+ or K+/H+ antiporter